MNTSTKVDPKIETELRALEQLVATYFTTTDEEDFAGY